MINMLLTRMKNAKLEIYVCNGSVQGRKETYIYTSIKFFSSLIWLLSFNLDEICTIVQNFLQIILFQKRKRGNFVYPNWVFTSIHLPLSLVPKRSNIYVINIKAVMLSWNNYVKTFGGRGGGDVRLRKGKRQTFPI